MCSMFNGFFCTICGQQKPRSACRMLLLIRALLPDNRISALRFFFKITGRTGSKISVKDLFDDVYAILFLIFLYKSICCGYSFELHRLGTHNICPYKVDKKYTGCNLKTTELLKCALIGVCAVIRVNPVLSGIYTQHGYISLRILHRLIRLFPGHILESQRHKVPSCGQHRL